MGATFSLGKKAAVLVSDDGTLYYALFEQTYEGNCFPHTPRWNCRHFGEAASCMRKIIRRAADTEDGMLKGDRGYITPSDYIGEWRHALAHPVRLAKTSASANLSSIRGLDASKRKEIETVLKACGVAAHTGIAHINLETHAAALEALCDSGAAQAWYFLGGNDFTDTDESWAAYAPSLKEARLGSMSAHSFTMESDAYYWIAREGQGLEFYGRNYFTIEKLIAEEVVPAEAAKPGCAESIIRQIRDVIAQSQPLPDDRPVTININDISSLWDREAYTLFLHKMGRLQAAPSILTTLGAITAANAGWEFGSVARCAKIAPPEGFSRPIENAHNRQQKKEALARKVDHFITQKEHFAAQSTPQEKRSHTVADRCLKKAKRDLLRLA